MYLLITCIAIIFALSYLFPINFIIEINDPFQWQYVCYYIAFGVLGSAVSGILSKRSLQIDPFHSSDAGFWLEFAKITLGAASAIVVVTAAYAEIINIGSITPSKLLIISFLSGFSEKLLTGIVNSYFPTERQNNAHLQRQAVQEDTTHSQNPKT